MQLEVVLIREMGWTWDEFLDQPIWLTRNLLEMMAAEGRNNKLRQLESSKD